MQKIFIFAFLLHEILPQNLPCDNFWSYTLGFDLTTQGLITLQPKNYQQHHLHIVMTVAAKLPSNYFGDISSVKGTQSTVNDIQNGLPILYRVRFPIQSPLPKLIAIYYNNELLCSEPSPSQNYGFVTTIQLDHNIFTNRPVTQSQPPAISYITETYQTQPQLMQQSFYNTQPAQTQAPVTDPPQTPPTIPNISNRISESSFECGVPKFQQPKSLSLVINGYAAKKGQFPWLAAFYYNSLGYDGFICGGNLISTKLVLTAAHCIKRKDKSFEPKAEESFFSLGKYFLTPHIERDVIDSGVSQFILHPSYDAEVESYDADLAIAVLQRTITFTNFIQPICIWTQTSSYSDIISKKGVVAGLGRTESSVSASEKMNWLQLPVVEESTCLRSNPVFLKITSRRTFCAGNRDGKAPCVGDSGGGFAIKYGEKWYLRGIVSSSIYDQELQTCDTSNYAVFTDVAQFNDWIMEKVEHYG